MILKHLFLLLQLLIKINCGQVTLLSYPASKIELGGQHSLYEVPSHWLFLVKKGVQGMQVGSEPELHTI